MGAVQEAVAKRIQDKKPYIEVKDAIVARSGIYMYSKAEVLERGHKPKIDKEWYAEFRPAAVIVRAKDKFNLVYAQPEHTAEYITPENARENFTAIVGGPIDVVALDEQDIALKAKLAFFTKESYDYYMAGNKETSADYDSVSELVDNPEKVGYDLIMTDIISVNNVAITAHGRGGPKVRVQDSLVVPKPASDANIIDKTTGRTTMGIFSAMFGLGKPNESFSAHVKDALVLAAKQGANVQDALDSVMALVNPFTDSVNKQALIGAVRDSFTFPEEIQKNWKETAPLLDGLFTRCQDAEAAQAAAVKDALKEKDPPKKEEDDEDEKSKKAESKDSFEAVIAAVKDSNAKLVDERLAAFEKRIPDLIADGVKAAIGAGSSTESRQQDSMFDAGDNADFIHG